MTQQRLGQAVIAVNLNGPRLTARLATVAEFAAAEAIYKRLMATLLQAQGKTGAVKQFGSISHEEQFQFVLMAQDAINAIRNATPDLAAALEPVSPS